jgi:hypothetical protein
MDHPEARRLLLQQLSKYRQMSYAELAALVGETEIGELAGESGTRYQFEIDFVWDSPKKPNDIVRVLGSIDDGGIRAFVPLTEGFLMAPDGTLVGE